MNETTMMQTKTFTYKAPFRLECGEILPEVDIAYSTFGKINETADNIVWVCHALTANSVVTEWWPGLFGEHDYFNPKEHFVICANMIGSCYGSTYALSNNPDTNQPYYHDFPNITVRDMIQAYDLLRQELGIKKVQIIIGGSMGGQQALEWAILRPELFNYLIPIATNARHSPWGIAFNEAQRMAINADRTWKEKHPRAGIEGMRAARATALISYRHYDTYWKSQLDYTDEKLDDFRAISYQQYQGDKLATRFDAFAYWTLSKAMDSHNVGRGRGGVEKALGQIKTKTFVIGLSSDVLFPISEQKTLAEAIPYAEFLSIDSFYGHDGFLTETQKLSVAISGFLEKVHQ